MEDFKNSALVTPKVRRHLYDLLGPRIKDFDLMHAKDRYTELCRFISHNTEQFGPISGLELEELWCQVAYIQPENISVFFAWSQHLI